jgi:feruloyl-CoA synthase
MASPFFDDPRMLAPPRVARIPFDDGSFVLRSPEPLKPYARCVGEWIERWAAETPDAPAVAERDAQGDWKRLSWRELRRAIGAVAQSLLGLKLPPHRPVVVLSDNGLDHLLLMLAAMHVGRAVCTVSSAYCRLTQDYSKIHGILATLGPALVYASDSSVYGPPLDTSGIDAVMVFSQGAEVFPGALAFDTCCAPPRARR